jgi:hypothetical protein
MAKLEDLIGEAFDDLPVVEHLPVPGYPRRRVKQLGVHEGDPDELDAFLRHWRPNFIGEAHLEDGSRFAFCNKLNPHALFDTMLVQTDAETRCAFAELTESQSHFVLSEARRFVGFVSDPATRDRYGLDGGILHLVYNTSKHTRDRENGQGYSKRFHLHMNYWPPGHATRVPPRPFREVVEPGRRRRLLDPVTPLAGRIIDEIVKRHGLFPDHRGFADLPVPGVPAFPHPPGYKLVLSNGWDDLLDPLFVRDLRRLDRLVDETHRQLQEAFTGEADPAPRWKRHRLLHRAEIERRLAAIPLPPSVGEDLGLLAAILRDATPGLLERCRRRPSTANRHLTMNGANYFTGFYSPHPNGPAAPVDRAAPVLMVVQCKLFSDVGGAGMPYTATAGVMELARQARAFRADEQAARVRFQQAFVAGCPLPARPSTEERPSAGQTAAYSAAARSPAPPSR